MRFDATAGLTVACNKDLNFALRLRCLRNQRPHRGVSAQHALLRDVQRAVGCDEHPGLSRMPDGVDPIQLLHGAEEPTAVSRHPMWFHAVGHPPHSAHTNDDESKPHVIHDRQHGACVGIATIACDTVRRGRGCSGANVNGRIVGLVLLGDTFDDPQNARIILLAAVGLVVLGLLVAAGTVWWWRSSEVEHPALGPLEVMGSRSWGRGDYSLRRRSLEAARPEGAEPVDAPMIPTSEPVDLEAAALAPPWEFDDLIEFSPAAAVVERSTSGVAESSPAESSADVVPVEVAPVDIVPVDIAPVDIEEVAGAEAIESTVPATGVPRPIDPLLRLQHDE